MRSVRLFHAIGLAVAVILSSCAHPDVTPRVKPPATESSKSGDSILDPMAIARAQKSLNALGYAAGPADADIGPRTVQAIKAFQRDQNLREDGHLTEPVAHRIGEIRSMLGSASPALSDVGTTLYFSDGTRSTIASKANGMILWQSGDGTHHQRNANFVIRSEPGYLTDAPENFLAPLTPGRAGSYNILVRERGGAQTKAATVACKAGHIVRTHVPAGTFDALDISCTETSQAKEVTTRRWWYAYALGLPIRTDVTAPSGDVTSQELLAVRPAMESWPEAARTGFEWAVTHALETPTADDPIEWSSTGVPSKFSIHVDPNQLMPLGSIVAPEQLTTCRHYELVKRGGSAPSQRFPGLACKTATGQWIIPGHRPYVFASPNAGAASASALPALPTAEH